MRMTVPKRLINKAYQKVVLSQRDIESSANLQFFRESLPVLCVYNKLVTKEIYTQCP